MTVLITDTGRVDQHLLDGAARRSTTTALAELRAAFNAALGGQRARRRDR